MEIFTNGMYTLLNGLLTFLHDLASPVTIALVICAVSLAWLAVLECDELDRQGIKPVVGTH